MSAHFRYRPEGAEAQAWKRIALALEVTERAVARHECVFYTGLCDLVVRCPSALRTAMRRRIRLFHRRGAGRGIEYFWPTYEHRGWPYDEIRGRATDRITAAWLCYWMAREEGV